MNFKTYLQEQKLKTTTISGHLNNLKRFIKWAESESINYKTATYNQLLEFIQSFQNRNVSKMSVNLHLNSITKYYDYLVITAERTDNPAKEIRLKSNQKRVLKNVFTTQELEEIYTTYQNRPVWKINQGQATNSHQRNLVILGLFIFQGVQTSELKKLEKSHLNLLQGTIYIPSIARSNSRNLKLNVRQILPLQIYLNQTAKDQETLFKPAQISNSLTYLKLLINNQLKNEKTPIRNAQHIRSSVIMNWLKQYNIRQVQYMAGHKYISSTERYKEEDLKTLQEQISLHHPMK